MPCYRPWKPNARMEQRFELIGKRIERLPCGRCVGCRLDYARSWSVRCQHEAQLYDSNLFVTLTYDDDHLPFDRSLSVRHAQLFMKKLRKRVRGFNPGPNGKHPVRFFCAGEYGTTTDRPHYHFLLFNVGFDKRERVGKRLFVSDELSDSWEHGSAYYGSVTPSSASYVAQYSLKKVYGRVAGEDRYFDPVTGAFRKPEFCTMSRRPGIGAWWYEAFKSDVLPRDYVVVEGRRVRVPRFYATRFEAENPEEFGNVREERERKVLSGDKTVRQDFVLHDGEVRRRDLAAAEVAAEARLKLFSERM